TMYHFQKDNWCARRIDAEQMQMMADTGYYKDRNGNFHKVSPEVQDAAKKFMADGGKMFKDMESAANGRHDGKLSARDYRKAIENGTVAPPGAQPTATPDQLADMDAAGTISDFQYDKLDDELLSPMQLKMIADTGYLRHDDGSL